MNTETRNIEVIDEIEVSPEPVFSTSEIEETPQVVVHQLEDANEVATQKETIVDTEVAFELKNKPVESTQTKVEPSENINPIDQPISEALRSRVSERRARMKEFNYKFKNTNNIDEIEKQPAYKRAGVNIDDVSNESNISRTSLSTDSNDDLQLRKRNSFLHDNVD